MENRTPNQRKPQTEVDSMFIDRWSPRAFISEPLTEHQIETLFEAVRWAPSCFNEQPWLFLYATQPEERKTFSSILVKKNQLWASQAPLLMFVMARRKFKMTGKDNRHAPFDAGAAWMSLALQARRLGLYAHAMAGFNLEKAYEVLGVSKEEYNIIAAIAVGRKGDASQLPDDLRQMEMPNDRKSSSEVATQNYPLNK
jgi:nitroreductase